MARSYRIQFHNPIWDDHVLEAETRSKACYASWKAATEAGYYTKRLGGLIAFRRAVRSVTLDRVAEPQVSG